MWKSSAEHSTADPAYSGLQHNRAYPSSSVLFTAALTFVNRYPENTSQTFCTMKFDHYTQRPSPKKIILNFRVNLVGKGHGWFLTTISASYEASHFKFGRLIHSGWVQNVLDFGTSSSLARPTECRKVIGGPYPQWGAYVHRMCPVYSCVHHHEALGWAFMLFSVLAIDITVHQLCGIWGSVWKFHSLQLYLLVSFSTQTVKRLPR